MKKIMYYIMVKGSPMAWTDKEGLDVLDLVQSKVGGTMHSIEILEDDRKAQIVRLDNVHEYTRRDPGTIFNDTRDVC